MKGGSILCWRAVVGVGVNHPGAAFQALGSSEPWWPGGERPCSAGIRSERVEALGGDRAYDLDACGRLGRRDERARMALQYIPRSLVSAPAVDHRASRWRRPAAGWGGRIHLLRGSTDVSVNLGGCQL